MHKYDFAAKRRRRWIIIGSSIALVVLIAVGVAVGVVLSKNNDSSQGSSNTQNSSSGGSNNDNPSNDPSNDPSIFAKDPSFHKSLYGMAYTPEGSLLPNCGNSLENVIKDVQIMSQLTSRVRLYGADCNQSALVLEAIKQTKVDIKVFLGNYVLPTERDSYIRQRDLIRQAIETYGPDNIAGITVGNEFMLNYLVDRGQQDPNGPIGMEGSAILKADIQDTRDMLTSMGVNIPVGNSDAGSYFSTEILSSVDYGLSNVHAWFANTTAEAAADWVMNFFEETNVQPASLLPNQPKMYIAETGWPTASSDAANANNGFAAASEANLQIFLDTFICQANSRAIPYFFFEFFDEKWKDIQFGGVEGWWGLFRADRTLKGVTIPDCLAP